MKLIIASNNKHKLIEMKAILSPFFDEIVSMKEAGIEHETVEDGVTFMQNAEKRLVRLPRFPAAAPLPMTAAYALMRSAAHPEFFPHASAAITVTTRQTTACCLRNCRELPTERHIIPAPLSLPTPTAERSAQRITSSAKLPTRKRAATASATTRCSIFLNTAAPQPKSRLRRKIA